MEVDEADDTMRGWHRQFGTACPAEFGGLAGAAVSRAPLARAARRPAHLCSVQCTAQGAHPRFAGLPAVCAPVQLASMHRRDTECNSSPFAMEESRHNGVQVTSSAKRRRRPGSNALAQTPDGSFRDLMANARDLLLNHCGFTSVPEVGRAQHVSEWDAARMFASSLALRKDSSPCEARCMCNTAALSSWQLASE
jgi:hypothetical protein